MAILQGAVTNPNCQGLAPSPNQNAIRILQDMCNATSHSATQANGGFGSTHGGSPYDQRTTVGSGVLTYMYFNDRWAVLKERFKNITLLGLAGPAAETWLQDCTDR